VRYGGRCPGMAGGQMSYIRALAGGLAAAVNSVPYQDGGCGGGIPGGRGRDARCRRRAEPACPALL